MIEFNDKEVFRWILIVGGLVLVLMALVLASGCVSAGKEVYRELKKTPTPTPSLPPTPAPPTPRPTPAGIQTLAPYPVDPFQPGPRWEGQWYQWNRKDVQGINSEGKKELNIGVIVYRHAFLDSYSWYNNAMGQYYVQEPPKGYRYFVVWVHEEMIGNSSKYDPSMWVMDEFSLQYGQSTTTHETEHNPVNRILEFDNYHDYYDTVTAGPFGYQILYTAHSPETGGYEAMEIGWLRMGEGNAIDGYLIFEVPEKTQLEDIKFLANFATFGSASWKFTKY